MNRAAPFVSVLKNKYVLATLAFALLMLFFDHNDVFVQRERKKQLDDLLASKAFYQKEIEKTKKELLELQQNPLALEKYARENFLMKRDNEDVFIVDQPSDTAFLKN